MGDPVAAQPDIQQIVLLLQQLQADNASLRATVTELQQIPVVPTTVHIPEPKIALPEKFQGNRSKFRGFINQVRLIIQLQPQRYPDDATQVGLLGSLLSGTALSWFAPLIESNSELLRDFPSFLEEFEGCFGEVDKGHVAANKIRQLRQAGQSASTYAAEFRQLSSDLGWNQEALIAQFRSGLRDDVKDLMLTLPDPTTLNEVITQAVRCDARLFERKLERRSGTGFPKAAVTPTPSRVQPTPMELDAVQIRGPLTQAEKHRRRSHNLCLYCGQAGHIAVNCPNKVRPRGALHAAEAGNEQA